MGQLYATSSLGGNWTAPKLTEKLRSISQPMYRLRSLCDAKEAMAKGAGATWMFDKSGNVGTAGGTLVETNTIPETEYVTTQGTGTIYEYGELKGLPCNAVVAGIS